VKLTNTTDFPDYFLRRLYSWCCKELEISPRYIREIAFRNSSRAWGGLAYLSQRRIGVRIGTPESFPCKTKKHRYGLQETIADQTEALIEITAHELAHHEQYIRGSKTRQSGSGGGSERMTDQQAFRVLRTFREQREQLLAVWYLPPAQRPVSVKLDRNSEKLAHYEVLLARWNKKLKTAQTKIRRYRTKIKYYQKRKVAHESDDL
jgi:hypothetical protein